MGTETVTKKDFFLFLPSNCPVLTSIKVMEDESELTKAVIALADATNALTKAIATVKQLLEKRVEGTAWLTPKEAASRLGVKHQWILTRIRDGRYKHGVHYVDTSDGDRPKYRVSVAAIEKELAKVPEKRKPAKR